MSVDEQMKFIYEICDSSLPRLGPGDEHSTVRALRVLLSMKSDVGGETCPARLKILDIGCGNGAQTIQLGRHADGTILAVDNHQPYLDELKRRAEAAGVSERIHISLRDMSDIGLPESSFDLIWSEGALYSMGFCEGLGLCHSLLVPGGLLAVSELCWLRPDPPAECRRFLDNEYPAMVDIDTNLAFMKNSGYRVAGHFTLPKSAWLESYYHPLEERLQLLRRKYAAVQERLDMLDLFQMEIDIYRTYSDYYGYVFFMMQKKPS